jgi:Uma2 family endonuclease
MSSAPKRTTRMTTDEFLPWALQQPGRFELVDGVPVRMQAELNRHTRAKNRICRVLENAVAAAGLPCEAWADGASVRINDERCREPDVVLTCGVVNDDDALEVFGVLLVVEVLSPSTGNEDKSRKLADYALVPGLQHYLIVDAESRAVIHHHFSGDGVILTRILRGGDILLEPPGLTLAIDLLLPKKAT